MVSSSSTSLVSCPLACSPARGQVPAGVAGHAGGVAGRLLGQVGQFPGDAQHRLLGLLGAARQRLGQLVGATASRAALVPHPGTGRRAGGLEAPDRGLQLADRPGQQPGVGRIAHVCGDHGGVDPYPMGSQQLVLGRGGKQRLVQGRDGGFAQAAGELDQGSGVGHPAAQGMRQKRCQEIESWSSRQTSS
jgi:hypothetical protein